MEQQPVLHWRKHIDIFDALLPSDETVQLLLVHACQRKIRGCVAAGLFAVAMRNRHSQAIKIAPGQALDRLPAMQLFAVTPGELQSALPDESVDLQKILTPAVQGLLTSAARAGRPE